MVAYRIYGESVIEAQALQRELDDAGVVGETLAQSRTYLASAIAISVFVSLLAAGCSASTSQQARSRTLAACAEWSSAGLGVPTVGASTRRDAMKQAIGDAEAAARLSSKWTVLRDSLVTVDRALAAHAYYPAITPAGVANYQATSAACAQAGEEP